MPGGVRRNCTYVTRVLGPTALPATRPLPNFANEKPRDVARGFVVIEEICQAAERAALSASCASGRSLHHPQAPYRTAILLRVLACREDYLVSRNPSREFAPTARCSRSPAVPVQVLLKISQRLRRKIGDCYTPLAEQDQTNWSAANRRLAIAALHVTVCTVDAVRFDCERKYQRADYPYAAGARAAKWLLLMRADVHRPAETQRDECRIEMRASIDVITRSDASRQVSRTPLARVGDGHCSEAACSKSIATAQIESRKLVRVSVVVLPTLNGRVATQRTPERTAAQR